MMRRLVCFLMMAALLLGTVAGLGEGTVTPSEPERDAQGWFENGDGQKVSGDLEELIAIAGEETIFVRSEKAVKIGGIDARSLIGVRFAPDEEVFSGGEFVVRITQESPDGAQDIGAIEDVDLKQYEDLTQEQIITVYIWVMQIIEEEPTAEPSPEPTAEPVPGTTAGPTSEPSAEPTAEPTAEPSAEPSAEPTAEPSAEPSVEPTQEPIVIGVQAEGAVQGEWSSVVPVFTLSGIPEERDDLYYAVILYDRQIERMEGNVFSPESEGVFSVRFAIMDAMGDIVSASDSRTLYLDRSAPEQVMAMPSQQKSYAMVLMAADSLSGVEGASVDGGATWEPIENEVPMGWVFGRETVLEPGMLQVKDKAGNIWKNEEQILFGAVYKGSSGGYYGPSKEHSENTTGDDGKTGYAQVYLTAGEEPVAQMDITGRQLVLRAGFCDEVLEAEFMVQFGAKAGTGEDGERFGGTESLHTGEMTAQDDMLLLSAVLPEEAPEGAEPEWIWSFDGAALRTLYASGVDTLVLCAGESAALIPTEGFAAGTEYTKLKIGGVGSRYFLYEAAMKGAGEEKRAPDMLNLTEDMDFELRVAVQGQEYVLAPYAGEEMYCDGVRVIPLEWLDMTEDEYPAPEALN